MRQKTFTVSAVDVSCLVVCALKVRTDFSPRNKNVGNFTFSNCDVQILYFPFLKRIPGLRLGMAALTCLKCFAIVFLLIAPKSLAFLHTLSLPRHSAVRHTSWAGTRSSFQIERSPAEQHQSIESRINEKIYRMNQRVPLPSKVQPEKCIIVGVDKTLHFQQTGEELDTYESLCEMMELCKTANLHIVASCVQRMSVPNPKSYLGEGKMAELREMCKMSGAQVVVVDDDISPRQQRCIEEALSSSAVQGYEDYSAYVDSSIPNKKRNHDGLNRPAEAAVRAPVKVLDRTAIILDIFAQHAQSREGQLQVELAMMEYRSTRGPNVHHNTNGNSDNTVGDGKGSSGAGLRGPGESKLELDKRKIKTRILLLKEEIAKLQNKRQAQRSGRARLGVPIVALVGYTNAGKSTLLNQLSHANVLAENMLFATLDPTTRKIRLPARTAGADNSSEASKENTMDLHTPQASRDPDVTEDVDSTLDTSIGSTQPEHRLGMEILLTDTVGFISKLPSSVVAAFRATLESLADADVLIHVCDRSSPTWEKQRAVVYAELARIAELSGHRAPIVEFWNKVDALPADVCENLTSVIQHLPIEMDLAHSTDKLGSVLGKENTETTFLGPRTVPVYSAPAVEVDDELYMCSLLPDSFDSAAHQHRERKQTKNQKRSKDRPKTHSESRPPPQEEKIVKVALNTHFDRNDAGAFDASDYTSVTTGTARRESLSYAPTKHKIFTTAGSALTGLGIRSLIARVEDALSLSYVPITLHIPFVEDQGVSSNILLRGVVNNVKYTNTGTTIDCRLPVALAENCGIAKYKISS